MITYNGTQHKILPVVLRRGHNPSSSVKRWVKSFQQRSRFGGDVAGVQKSHSQRHSLLPDSAILGVPFTCQNWPSSWHSLYCYFYWRADWPITHVSPTVLFQCLPCTGVSVFNFIIASAPVLRECLFIHLFIHSFILKHVTCSNCPYTPVERPPSHAHLLQLCPHIPDSPVSILISLEHPLTSRKKLCTFFFFYGLQSYYMRNKEREEMIIISMPTEVRCNGSKLYVNNTLT